MIPQAAGNPFTYTPLPGHPSGSTKVGRETTSRSKSELLTSDSVNCESHSTASEVRSSDFDREVVSRQPQSSADSSILRACFAALKKRFFEFFDFFQNGLILAAQTSQMS